MASETSESTEAPGHEGAGGLPQFDATWWPGQIVWFLVIFLVVYLAMRGLFVPKIGGAIDAREGKIEGDIAQARALKDEADAQAAAAAAETAAARASAQKLANDARTVAKASAAARLADAEAKQAADSAAAEERIRAAQAEAMTNVRTIASDTATAIVEKLTGSAASPAEINAAMAERA